ncbi:MAG: hypothetical protein Q7S31_03580 [bacterium]|nr:hypothetical protein [bacterium]
MTVATDKEKEQRARVAQLLVTRGISVDGERVEIDAETARKISPAIVHLVRQATRIAVGKTGLSLNMSPVVTAAIDEALKTAEEGTGPLENYRLSHLINP